MTNSARLGDETDGDTQELQHRVNSRCIRYSTPRTTPPFCSRSAPFLPNPLLPSHRTGTDIYPTKVHHTQPEVTQSSSYDAMLSTAGAADGVAAGGFSCNAGAAVGAVPGASSGTAAGAGPLGGTAILCGAAIPKPDCAAG